MLTNDLEKELMKLAQDARNLGYKVTTPKLFVDNVYGNKLAYYNHGGNKIVIHEHYVENADESEIENTIKHELAHAIVEQNNIEIKKDGTLKRVWHGQAWKDINDKLGGNSERYHIGNYIKPVPVKKTMKELFKTQAKYSVIRWERGMFNQWFTRGYHVKKGEKGQLSVWEFVGEEYETSEDGKTSSWGRASVVYFDNNQVEPNETRK